MLSDEDKKHINSFTERVFKILEIPTNSVFFTFESPEGDGTPYITYKNGEYWFIFSERGNDFKKRQTQDMHMILYWISDVIVSDVAQKYALYHPHDGVEQRRIRFNKQLELLHLIDPGFEQKYREEIESILKRVPFTDGLPNTL